LGLNDGIGDVWLGNVPINNNLSASSADIKGLLADEAFSSAESYG
jgi:hypothetical protein